MTDFVATRRLYLGAGAYLEKGELLADTTPAEREPLLSSGAIRAAAKEQLKPKPKTAEKAKS